MVAMYWSFIVNGSITNTIDNQVPVDTAQAVRSWPSWSREQPIQLNLNQTGGLPTTVIDGFVHINITELVDPGLSPAFELVNAYRWEGGRGERCDFWQRVGGQIPE